MRFLIDGPFIIPIFSQVMHQLICHDNWTLRRSLGTSELPIIGQAKKAYPDAQPVDYQSWWAVSATMKWIYSKWTHKDQLDYYVESSDNLLLS